VRRVLKLARLLARDKLEPGDPVADATKELVNVLKAELDARSGDAAFAAVIEEKGKITAQTRSWRYGGELADGTTLELEVS
jgi:hypothetical protein